MRAELLSCGLIGIIGCTSPSSTGYRVVATTGDPPSAAVVGDAVPLKVVEGFSDGTQADLAPGATVVWTTPTVVSALPPDSDAPSPMPSFGDAPTVAFLANSERDNVTDLNNVLFVLDAGASSGGTATITATITGAGKPSSVSATLTIGATPDGDAGRGATVYAGACARCHGDQGQGSPANPDGTYPILGASYPYPAPGLNTAMGNLAGDPEWNAGLLAVAARADVDNGGIALRAPMPDWMLGTVDGRVLTTQDFADIYAFLKTQ